jgi:hypothetical protein
MNDNHNIAAQFEAIDWNTIDLNAVHAFYEAINRPHIERALLLGPIALDKREAWRRQCVSDLQAMQKRACPGCAA